VSEPLFFRIAILISLTSIPAFPQGFGAGAAVAIGKRGESVELTRTLPPIVDLAGQRVSVETNGASGVPRDVIDQLTIRARAVMAKSGYSIEIVSANAQRAVRCMIPLFELTDTRKEQQSGTAMEQFVVVKGNMAAIIDVLDPRTDRTLDTETLKTTYEKWFKINLNEPGQSQGVNINIRKKNRKLTNERVPTLQEKYALVTEGIVTKLAEAFVPPPQSFNVPLPRRILRPLSLMANRGEWAELREAAQNRNPLAKPEEDSYRVYLIGLAAEALAYKDRHNAAEATKLLSDAIQYYAKAKELKAVEKAYATATARAQEALDRYNRIKPASVQP